MNQIESVFSVNNSSEGVVLAGAGQQTVSDALKSFPGRMVKLKGFLINGEFKKADMSSHWERTRIKREKQDAKS